MIQFWDVDLSAINTVNNYMQVTGMATGENFAFFIYRHFVKILWASAVGFNGNTFKIYSTCL